jgi:hypothetical protein
MVLDIYGAIATRFSAGSGVEQRLGADAYS